MDKESSFNFSDFSNDEVLLKYLKILKEKYFDDELKFIHNKLWKLFLESDGSMTKNLKFLIPDIKMKLISTNKIENNNLPEIKINESSILLEILKNFDYFVKFDFSSEKLILRKIVFYTNQGIHNKANENDLSSSDLKMIGLSYWDEDIYNELYSDQEEEHKPIGLIMIEKEIEFFKIIKNFVLTDSNQNKFIFRFSSFKIKNKIAFILLEILEVNKFVEFFGNFE